MATLKDIAEYTGYSQATISRVLHSDPKIRVTDVTRHEIIYAAKELHYQTKAQPRRYRKRGSLQITIAEALTPYRRRDNPYYLQMKIYIKQICNGYGVKLSHAYADGQQSQLLPATAADGVIALGMFSDKQIERLTRMSRNLVFVDASPDETRFDSVVLNAELGIQQALDYLGARKHRAIGYIGPNGEIDGSAYPVLDLRKQCFIRYMQERGEFHEQYMFETLPNSEEECEALLAQIRAGKVLPTALVAADEAAAISAVRTIQIAGLSVPHDISVLGFSDMDNPPPIVPPLTSIRTHAEVMSAAAIHMLLERIEAANETAGFLPLQIVIAPTLNEQQSVAGPMR
ncbi:MAG: substrate-binding domain-containing protein [Eubacteriales bacterium]|nr:substrate-binding domain-containing protein [Eubacteriales bacterium]